VADITTELAIRQRDNEWYFGACLISGSADLAVKNCSWLEPSVFINKDLGGLWKDTLDGIDPLKSANNHSSQFLTNLLSWAHKTPNLVRPDEYARVINECHYSMEVAHKASGIIKAISDKDYAGVRSLADEIGKSSLADTCATATAAQVGQEFSDVLSAGTARHVLTRLPLDDDLGGLFGSELVLVAARPGMGKTAMMLQIAKNVALDKHTVLFSSLEMARLALWARMACGAAGHSWKDVRIGNITDIARAEIRQKSNQLVKNLGDHFIIDDESRSVSAIHASAMKIKPDLVIVDHLGEVEWHNPDASDVVWLGQAAKYLRTNIARRMGIPLVIIHQLNRDVEKRQDKRPLLSDLRWSGELEQMADRVLMIYRQDYYEIDIKQSVVPAEVWTRKDRQGVMNSLTMMAYNLNTQNFDSMP
jgi:replicative DNA helicase